MNNEEIIEKAYKVGDPHPKGKNLVWTEYKPGKFDWRQPKKGAAPAGGNSGGNAPAGGNSGGNAPAGGNSGAKPTPAPAQGNDGQEDDDESTPKSGYKKPAAKVQYKGHDEKFDIPVPNQWTVKSKAQGVTKTAHLDKVMAMLEAKTDDDLLKILNNHSLNRFQRQIAYDLAQSRGIPESKIDTKGSLEDEWKKQESIYNKTHAKNVADDDDTEEDYELNGITVEECEEFMKEFPNGDQGWREKNDKRVQKKFNGLSTLVDRQRYDSFLDFQKRQDADYLTPQEVVCDLNADYLTFMETDMSPLFISAGGAGAGKTYGFKKLAEELNVKKLDEGDDPATADWGYVNCANPKSEKEFYEMLKKYNGTDGSGRPHILVFDDNDAILTGKQYRATMKTIADTDPKSRVFKDPDGNGMIKFTGKIMIITNKTSDGLISAAGNEGAEDVKAVLSRATKSDIQFTVNENMEILEDRYKTMGIDGLKMPPSVEDKAREEVFQFIKANKDKLDPAKFTVRKFREIMVEVQNEFIRTQHSKNNAQIASLVGSGRGWQKKAMGVLNKADEELDIMKAEGVDATPAFKKMPKEVKKKLADIKKKNPKLFDELFGKRALAILDTDDEPSDGMEEEDTEKGNDFGSMSISEAEELLLG